MHGPLFTLIDRTQGSARSGELNKGSPLVVGAKPPVSTKDERKKNEARQSLVFHSWSKSREVSSHELDTVICS